MIRMIQSKSAAQAKSYFNDALQKADYYLNDSELPGIFFGKLAERLGLSGIVSKREFYALCDNIDPNTGEQLTPRTNENRTVGYDINFHAPKSLSVISGLTKDNHLIEAFSKSVEDTMREIEADSMTRVRKGGQYHDRPTGELIWSTFVHQTSRPVEGKAPDPHLHAHAYVFNMTHDGIEGEIKAGQFRNIKKDMPFYQALFYKHLSDRLIELGYEVEKKGTSFEIVGVGQEVRNLFSKRTDEITKFAKAKGVVNAKELAELGARTRAKKQKGLTMAELREDWRSQILEAGYTEGQSNTVLRNKSIRVDKTITVSKCVDLALSHTFERSSVKDMRRIQEVALLNGIGNSEVKPDEIIKLVEGDSRLITINDGSRKISTTKEVLKEEKRMIELARQGKGKLIPLYRTTPELNLTGEQANAVGHILTTSDRISIIRGAAGTGKTYLMQEARKMIERRGKKLHVVAPTAQASRGVLRSDGFKEAETVALLLNNKEMQNKLTNQVLWVDEAGLLGTKDMGDLIQLANDKNAQLILGGDTRQHASVVRGDALRILNTVGNIPVAEVTAIRRQRDEAYRSAIESLSKGEILKGFNDLDSMGAIQQVDPDKPFEKLVKDYVSAIKNGKTALVICPTHKQGDRLTAEIREQLRKNRKLGKKEVWFESLAAVSLTNAEKQDWTKYDDGNVVQFNQNLKGIKRGSAWTVSKVEGGSVHIKNAGGKTELLPLEKARHFEVMARKEIPLSNGDIVRITKNSLDEKKRLLNNGEIFTVKAISKSGKIHLKNPVSKNVYTVAKDFGHLTHAHCITSHSSQGKTVDEVFIAQPAATFGASDAKQFYVSASRGKDKATFYTDDKVGLLDNVADLAERTSAHELLAYSKHMDKVVERQRVLESQGKDPIKEIGAPERPRLEKDREYGPRI